jgi:hypothetical protein
MEYQYLDVAQRRAMLEARLRQLESEYYGHTLNKAGAGDDEMKITAADEAMAIIDASYEVTSTELAALGPVPAELEGE